MKCWALLFVSKESLLSGILCSSGICQRRSKAVAVFSLYDIPIFSMTWNKMHGMQQAIWLISREFTNISNASTWYGKIFYCISLCFPDIVLCPCSSLFFHESSCEVCSLTKHWSSWSIWLFGFAFLIGLTSYFSSMIESICSEVDHVNFITMLM